MNYILSFLAFLYVFTGIFISINIFKHTLGKALGAVWFGMFWLPILIADYITNRMGF